MKPSTPLVFLSTLSATQALPRNNKRESCIQWEGCGDSKDEILVTQGGQFDFPLECATLSVPLDYTDSSAQKLDLDLVRVKAINGPSLGSILFNPGGPGHSGVEFVATSSARLHAVLDGRYDLVGFDTRGTGKTIPFACNVSEAPETATSSSSSLVARDMVKHNLTDYLFNGGWETVEIFAEQCAKDMNDTGSLISTAFVARDMVQIIDALGEDGLLRYWGMSYGTTLGATFAAMFPERVDRMLLDAVANPHEYTAGPWMDSILDLEKTYRGFLTECVASPEKCALIDYAGSDVTAEELELMINEALEKAYDPSADPPSILGPVSRSSGPPTSYDIKNIILQSMYGPSHWQSLAKTLVSFLNGTTDSNNSSDSAGVPPSMYNLGTNALQGIMCSDSTWRASSPEEIADIVEQQSGVSSFSDIFYHILTWPCAAWKIEAKERYSGNYTAKPNHPIMFVHTEHDPVTSLSGAINATAGFEGSVLLKSTGYGHGSLGHTSQCVTDAVRTYFGSGVLPEEGTECDPDGPAFDMGDVVA